MLSDLHEELVDEIRFISDFTETYGYPDMSVGCWAEARIFNVLHNCQFIRLTADAYIELEDGFGPMAVEVGKMKDGKWNLVYAAEDSLPIRVLRVGFDGSVWLLNPRGTPMENDLMKYWRNKLDIWRKSQP